MTGGKPRIGVISLGLMGTPSRTGWWRAAILSQYPAAPAGPWLRVTLKSGGISSPGITWIR